MRSTLLLREEKPKVTAVVPSVSLPKITTVATTAISNAISHAKSAFSSATASLANDVDNLHVNFSIGMRDFCVGYLQNFTCQQLPGNLTELLPDGIRTQLQAQLSYLNSVTSRVSPSGLQISLIVGTVFAVALATFGIWQVLDFGIRRPSTLLRTMVFLILVAISWILFLVPTCISWKLQSGLRRIPFVIVGKGVAPALCLTAFLSLTLLIIAIYFLVLRRPAPSV